MLETQDPDLGVSRLLTERSSNSRGRASLFVDALYSKEVNRQRALKIGSAIGGDIIVELVVRARYARSCLRTNGIFNRRNCMTAATLQVSSLAFSLFKNYIINVGQRLYHLQLSFSNRHKIVIE